MASWLGERVSLPVALHAQCAALVALRWRESVFQHAVLRARRAIRIRICYAVQMRWRIVYCTLGVQYMLLEGVADAARRHLL